ncbi:MAG TPA: biotin-dependent carboxyltransferase family protein [Candidatus Dormibacteraeota bacterium]
MTFEVLAPGPLTTVQDLGRPGWGAYGIPEGGAMDRATLRAANRLAGNPPGSAALEYTLRGPRLRWRGRRPVEVAVAGDTMTRRTLDPGDILDCGALGERARGYVAVQQGFAAVSVLGSHATCLAGGFGGFEGRPLRAGDRLRVNAATRAVRTSTAGPDDITSPRVLAALRIISAGRTGAAALRGLVDESWTVAEADRAGIRLAGPSISARPLQASRPVCAGAVQVTGEGQPIVLLRDHPTVGGYPLAGLVIGADLDHCAQLRPGAEVRFRRVTEAVALRALRAEAPDP